MKYFEYIYKCALLIILSIILFYTIRLVSYVDQIGLMVYRNTTSIKSNIEFPKPVGGNLLSGSDSSKVKITIFIDYQCAYCKQFFNQVIPRIEEKFVNIGVASIYTKHLPLSHIHPQAELYAKGAEYAKVNGSLKEYTSKVFTNDSDLDSASLNKILYSLNIDTIAFKESLITEGFYASVQKDLIEARGYNISGTPTTVINQKVILGYRDFEYFQNIIENELDSEPGSNCQ